MNLGIHIPGPTACFLCWHCSQQLGPHYTSVIKDGIARRVHFGCRGPAAALIEDLQPSGFYTPHFVPQGADWKVA